MATFGTIVMVMLLLGCLALCIWLGIKVGKQVYEIVYFKKHGCKPTPRPKKIKKSKQKDINEADL